MEITSIIVKASYDEVVRVFETSNLSHKGINVSNEIATIDLLHPEGADPDELFNNALVALRVNKKEQIRALTLELLDKAGKHAASLIDKALNSGAIGIEEWEEDSNPMIIPKTILIAALESTTNQYSCKGTSFEKQMKKDIKNIKYFI